MKLKKLLKKIKTKVRLNIFTAVGETLENENF